MKSLDELKDLRSQYQECQINLESYVKKLERKEGHARDDKKDLEKKHEKAKSDLSNAESRLKELNLESPFGKVILEGLKNAALTGAALEALKCLIDVLSPATMATISSLFPPNAIAFIMFGAATTSVLYEMKTRHEYLQEERKKAETDIQKSKGDIKSITELQKKNAEEMEALADEIDEAERNLSICKKRLDNILNDITDRK